MFNALKSVFSLASVVLLVVEEAFWAFNFVITRAVTVVIGFGKAFTVEVVAPPSFVFLYGITRAVVHRMTKFWASEHTLDD